MKKNYNPYTVPEGFFKENRNKAMDSYVKRNRHLKYAALSAAVAALLIVIPVFVKEDVEKSRQARQECNANNLAQMYDYDIFLQVNF